MMPSKDLTSHAGEQSRIPLPTFAIRGNVERTAQWLLGKTLYVRTRGSLAGGRIVETEAYGGAQDKACHAYQRRTARNEAMFAKPGTVYVYLIYGMYHCVNIVVGPEESPKAVLIRALEPVENLPVMHRRRNASASDPKALRALCSGPGKLCQALGITTPSHNFQHLANSKRIWISNGSTPQAISHSPRIGISQSTDLMWRYFESSSSFVSPAPKEIQIQTQPLIQS